ncbi:ATP-dependent helicase, partial [Pseudoalteromonas agarivorans]
RIDEQSLLVDIVVLHDTRLAPLSLEGYEPHINKKPKDNRKNTKKARKDPEKKRITGQRAPSRRRKN